MSAPLFQRMRELADTGHERAVDLRRFADEFEKASTAFYANPQSIDTPAFLGCWSRARRLWCDCSGEPLV